MVGASGVVPVPVPVPVVGPVLVPVASVAVPRWVAVNAVGLQARETGDHSTAEASFQRVVALQADSELVAAARGSLASGKAR